MSQQQESFDFIARHKHKAKQYKDQDLIKEYNRVVMSLSAKVDDLEFKLSEVK